MWLPAELLLDSNKNKEWKFSWILGFKRKDDIRILIMQIYKVFTLIFLKFECKWFGKEGLIKVISKEHFQN